jgi:hypothetical protein
MTYKTIEEWIERNPGHIGAIPIEVCRQIWGTKDATVQVSPFDFVEMVIEKEHLTGQPIFWAQWPNKEKNT